MASWAGPAVDGSGFIGHKDPRSDFRPCSSCPRDTDRPHVLHLRNSELGISYDAPDDTWLAIGPRVAMGGAQSVWIWNKGGRQIDVSVLDLRTAPRRMPQGLMATFMADQYRKAGNMVVVDRSELAGRPCEHLEIDPPAGKRQDMFLQERDGIFYGLIVKVETRDKELLAPRSRRPADHRAATRTLTGSDYDHRSVVADLRPQVI